MNRIDWAIVVIVGIILVLTGMVQVGLLNPNREFIGVDGSLHLHGRVDGRFLDYLLHGPPIPHETTFVHVESGRGTMGVVIETVPILSSVSLTVRLTIDWGRAPSIPEFVGILFEPIRVSVILVLDAISGNASGAVCGDGLGPNTCTWTNGAATNLWSTAGNWNGAGGPPQVGDTVIFNATSVANCTVDVATPALASLTITGTGSIYSGAITVNLTQTATWGAVAMNAGTTGTLNTAGFTVIMTSMTAAAGTLMLGASLVQVAGTFSKTAGTFNFNTSTVRFTANGNLTLVANSGNATIYSVTIDAGVTMTPTVRVGYAGILTINGTLASAANQSDITPADTGGTVTPIVFGGSGAWTGTSTLNWRPTGGNETINVAGGAYGTAGTCLNQSFLPVTNGGYTFQLQGAITCIQNLTFQNGAGAGTTDLFYSNGYNLTSITTTTTISLGPSTTTQIFGVYLGASGVTGFAAVNVGSGGMNLNFFDWGSSTITLAGTSTSNIWANNSLSTSWNAGTSSITFSLSSAVRFTMALGAPVLYVGGVEFNNVVFDPNAAITQTWSITNIVLSGTLTVRNGNGAGSTTLISAFTAGALVVGSGGTLYPSNTGINPMPPSKVSGNVTITGTYSSGSAGSSSLYLNGSSTQIIAANGASLGDLVLTGIGEKDFTQNFTTASFASHVTVKMKMTAGVTWTNNGPNISGSAAGLLTLVSSASGSAWNFTVPTGETAAYVNVSDSVASHTVTVACDGISQGGTGNSGWVFCPISGGTTLTFGSIDWTLGLFLLAFFILLAFAFLFEEFQGLFLIISGLAGIMVGFQTYLVTRSVLVSMFFGAIGMIVLTMGVLTTASNVAKRRTGAQ